MFYNYQILNLKIKGRGKLLKIKKLIFQNKIRNPNKKINKIY